jgi:hypothetical protein
MTRAEFPCVNDGGGVLVVTVWAAVVLASVVATATCVVVPLKDAACVTASLSDTNIEHVALLTS